MLQFVCIAIALALTVAAVAQLAPAIRQMLSVIRQGQPALGRTNQPGRRTLTMLKETVLHTRMLQWTWVGALHWFAFAAFIILSTAVLGGYFQLFDAHWAWPVIGHWAPFEWLQEFIGLLGAVAIIPLIIYRQIHHPRTEGRQSRFFGSTQWQAYFVEYMVLLESAAILPIRGAEYNLGDDGRGHFPLSSWIGDIFPDTVTANENLVHVIAAIKISLAMVWLIVIARNLTMGVAWHRFTAWFNIWFKREDGGRTALGAVKPLVSDGKAVTLDDIDDLDEDAKLGVGSIEDFSWKGILDFTTCTECGRCQSQCPAWNTEKPLSPKLLVMGLREHAYANGAGDETAKQRELIGKAHDGDWFYNPEGGGFVIDEDVLWSCTSCGACVQQCPVDIEHVDHIVDMRRYQVLVESNFPTELNQLFKGLENKGNPWNMSASARMDWAKGLPFEVKEVGKDLESLDEVEWLFWVGCAGAYEDRAKKTTRAVAELLDTAGVSFGVLGNGETCTGDPARRAGNEFVFQGLAQQNVETFKEFKVKKVVSTCAHCFNTLRNEYKEFGVELEVVHHTQLLNRLVREGKLTPIPDGAGAQKRSITYHDPCYIGRHNGVYEPPRELLQVLPGAEYAEMPRNSERSFCCGAGGARMWMEETIGERINVNRTREAVATGADQIAVGCPFCRVMLSDGLTAEQANGAAREEVEVLDVAQMLLASVKGEPATKAAVGQVAGTPASSSVEPASAASGVETNTAGPETAQPEASSSLFDDSSSLFDTPAAEAPAKPAEPSEASGSLFDDSSSLFDTPAPAPPPTPEPAPAEPEPGPTGGGSLFDIGEPEPEPEPEAPQPVSDTGATDLDAGGSLFDIGTTEQTPAPEKTPPPEPEPEPEAPQPVSNTGATDLDAGGSLFDIGTTEQTPAPEKTPPPEPEQPSSASADEESTEDESDEDEPKKDLNGPGSLFDL